MQLLAATGFSFLVELFSCNLFPHQILRVGQTSSMFNTVAILFVCLSLALVCLVGLCTRKSWLVSGNCAL